jgi:ABC-type branched-subunit amino acid transport system substrate-binding protein
MTGEWASWGKNCQQGTQLALEERQQQNMALKFDFVLEDSPSAKAMNALNAFKKLVEIDRAKFILGPMSPEEYAAVAPLADRQGIPLIPFVSSKISIPAAAFMWMDPDTQARRIADYVAASHQSVAILSGTQEWESQVGRAFKARLLEKGGSVPIFEEPPFDSTDVRAQIAKLSKAKFDAIFITSYPLFTLYLKSISAAQIKAPIYSIEIDQAAITAAGAASEGVEFIRPVAPNDKFTQAFQARWGAAPDVPASQCYDSVMVLSKAIASGVTDKESFARYFSAAEPFEGASGKISIQRGKTVMSTDLFKVKNGKMSYLRAVGDDE